MRAFGVGGFRFWGRGSRGVRQFTNGEAGTSWFAVAEAYADRVSAAGFVFSMALLAATAVYAINLSGAAKPYLAEFLALADQAGYDAGFKFDDLGVAGVRNTPQPVLFEALKLPYRGSSLFYDTSEARSRLLKVGWVETAEVRRVLPARLEVIVTERIPFARWEDGARKIQVISRDGRILGPDDDGQFALLPLYAGEGAAAEAQNFDDAFKDRDGLRRRIARAELVAGHFWTVKLDSGLTVKLPRKVTPLALSRLELDPRQPKSCYCGRWHGRFALAEPDDLAIDGSNRGEPRQSDCSADFGPAQKGQELMTEARRHALRSPSRLWPFKAQDDIVTIVDLGAQKLACAIVSLTTPRFGFDTGARNIKVLGSAAVRSSGFSAGRIVNMVAAETSIRRAVAQAEAQAGVTAGEVVVTGQFEGLSTQIFEAKSGSGQAVNLKDDIAAISAAAEEQCLQERRKLLHVFPFAAEDAGPQYSGGAPVGGRGEIDVAAISMPVKAARQIAACFSSSMLAVRALVAGPLAAGLAVTNSLERMAGILVIDLGAEATGYALFAHGVPLSVECVGLGGQHITGSIAAAFSLRRFEAERAKLRFGSASGNLMADTDLPITNGETGELISKFTLNHIIQSNASQLFAAINERLKGEGYPVPPAGAVLTGGGSLLPGIRELASHLLASEVRTAEPVALNGLSASGSLAALVGGCLYASRHQSQGEMACAPGIVSEDSSYASRISQWLRASF